MAVAETAPPQDAGYVRTTFTNEDGLPDNTINAITQTKNGLLWVGTYSGLASFDGRTFTRVDLRMHGGVPPGSINSLVEADDGDLWVGTDTGIVRIPKVHLVDPSLEALTSYRLGDEQSDEILALLKTADGGILAGTNHGLYRFDGRRFVPVLKAVYVSRITQLQSGRVLLITGEGPAEYVSPFKLQDLHIGSRLRVADKEIYDIFEDREGGLWFCTNHGVLQLGGPPSHPLEPNGPGTTQTFRGTRGPDGTMWVSTGIGAYAIKDGRLEGPTPNVVPRFLYVGRQGDLWIGTNGRGLTHLQPRVVQMFTSQDGLMNDVVMSVLPTHDGKLWIGNNCGAEIFDGTTFKRLSEKDGLANSCIWTMAEDRSGDVWLGTYGGGAFRYHGGQFTQFSMEQGLPSRIVSRIVASRDGSLWFATPDGISHFKHGAIHNYSIADGLTSNQVADVYEDRKGVIWAATKGGVDRLLAGRFVPVPSSDTQSAILPVRFAEDAAGNLFTLDFPRGISRIIGNRLVYRELPLKLSGMVESPDHALWFSSNVGIIRVPADGILRQDLPNTPLAYQQFGRPDGLNSTQNSVGSPNMATTPDGKLWVATAAGLAMIDRTRLATTVTKPRVFVVAASVDGKLQQIGDRLKLQPGIRHVEMTLAAVDIATPEKVRLQYRLEGVDRVWLDGNGSRTVVYTNVPTGLHRLYVRETDSFGQWDEGHAVYALEQLPYLYQRPWFQAGVALLVILLLVAIYLLRIGQIVKQTRAVMEARQIERASIARDLHDTFMQNVHGLVLHFHTGTRLLPEDSPVRKKFEDALTRSNGVLADGRSILQRLTEEKVSSHSMVETFTELGRDLSVFHPVNVDVSVSGRSCDIDGVVHEELIHVGREAMLNAFRHANASRIEVFLHFEVSELRLRICDDGKGISPTILREGGVPGHYGLPGMRERVSRAGGKVHIRSQDGKGTEVDVRIPGEFAYRVSSMTL